MASHVRSVPNPDESLVTRGSPASFEEFFEAERARLFGALSVMTGNRHEAEEVMQDAFLRLWERWERVSAMDEPVGFLYRTALNLYRKRLRRAAVAMRKVTNLLPPMTPLLPSKRGMRQRGYSGRSRHANERHSCSPHISATRRRRPAGSCIRASTVRVLTTRARASLKHAEEVRQ